jgi:MOSC domain-containing protein YiiM
MQHSRDEQHNAGKLVQINVNPQGGVPKYRVVQTRITSTLVQGDKQRNLKFHGGPERAVCLYSWEVICALQDEGHPIDCGTTGENLTISGIDWSLLTSGARLQVGAEVLLELTRETTPCNKIAASFIDGDFMRVYHKLRPGWSRWYARVLCEGVVREGDPIELLPQNSGEAVQMPHLPEKIR